MVYNKVCIGEVQNDALNVKYFVIQKERYYGVAIEQLSGDLIECDYEYFTEEQTEAMNVAKLMQKGFVTLTSMTEILDNYIS